MRAQDIITDDIVSRERRKPSKELGGKRVPGDYFGNRAEIKKRDRDLLSKEEFKAKQKQWFESEQLDEASDRTEIIIRKNTIPQDAGFRRKLDRFFMTVGAELSDEPQRVSDRAVLLTVPGNKAERIIHVLTELGIDVSLAKSLAEDDPCWKNYKQVGTKKKGGRRVPNCVPKESMAENFSNNMSTEDMISYLRQHHDKNLHPDYVNHLTSTNSEFVLKNIPLTSIRTELSGLDSAKVEQYKKMDFSKAPPIVVGSDGNILDGYHRANVAKALNIPTIKAYVGVKKQQGIEEETMAQAAKNPQGARFGGYYGATQRGAPRRGQGFGS